MARKSRKNVPSVMVETECSLPMGAVTKTAGNSVVQILTDLESIATIYHAAIYAGCPMKQRKTVRGTQWKHRLPI